AYKESDAVLVQPTVIVPFQVKRFADTGRIRPGRCSVGSGWENVASRQTMQSKNQGDVSET
ncbi:hypothetical protein MYX82_10765, partial [Acidobacteria bacterium AH-259-D05]|nr:hypothetical protein [Acidobacteria bacterium AH-259-D05]